MAATALVVLVNLVLSLVVGARLLAAGLRGRTPELALSVYFLGTAFLGTLCLAPPYAGLADPEHALPDGLARLLLAVGTGAMVVGSGGVYVFTWRTFRPGSPWAPGVAAAGCALGLAGVALEAATGGFAVRAVPGPGHWLAWAGRTAAMAWVCAESWGYRHRVVRRRRLGLADPVVANRFLLWALWSSAALVNLGADLGARVLYVLAAGTTELVPAVLRPITLGTMGVTMVLGSVSAATLFLTFFPPRAYRDWIAARASAA